MWRDGAVEGRQDAGGGCTLDAVALLLAAGTQQEAFTLWLRLCIWNPYFSTGVLRARRFVTQRSDMSVFGTLDIGGWKQEKMTLACAADIHTRWGLVQRIRHIARIRLVAVCTAPLLVRVPLGW